MSCAHPAATWERGLHRKLRHGPLPSTPQSAQFTCSLMTLIGHVAPDVPALGLAFSARL